VTCDSDPHRSVGFAPEEIIVGKATGGVIDFNAFFPVKVCINLDRRPDRWKKMVRAFRRHGIEDVVRFPAIDGRQIELPSDSIRTPGEIGCLRSHLAVVNRYRDAPRLMIFEDDCLFVPRFRELFFKYAAQVPADWHLLLFDDCRPKEAERCPVSRNVVVARSIPKTHAYALNRNVYGAFIALCEQDNAPADDCTVYMQAIFDCYCFTPRLIWQNHGDSDIKR
jgi:glycosyl transferase, family 25